MRKSPFIMGATVLLSIMAAAPLASKASAAAVANQAFGASYREWSAKWRQWLLSITASTNPDVDASGAFCAQGQSANVWFLAGTLNSTPVIRTCTIPTGKAIFFPLINNIGFKSTACPYHIREPRTRAAMPIALPARGPTRLGEAQTPVPRPVSEFGSAETVIRRLTPAVRQGSDSLRRNVGSGSLGHPYQP
jgi:hypothetical protein